MNPKRLVAMMLAGASAAAFAGLASAEGLPDPTRPPVGIEGEQGATPAQQPSGLQSIVRRPGGKSGAVINGQYVEVGGRIGDATLERVGEDSVVLRSAGGRETMYLTPGVGKKNVSTEAGAAKRRGKTEKAKP